jgi:hypothetical protein
MNKFQYLTIGNPTKDRKIMKNIWKTVPGWQRIITLND